jgi:hypothetical protein
MKPLKDLNGKLIERSEDRGLVRFSCPVCDPTHDIAINYGPEGWDKVAGNSIENLSIQPSILCLLPNCKFHGFITNGVVIWDKK